MGARRLTAAVVGLWLAVGMSPLAHADDREPPTRVAILGDSIVHGSSGDWTWRYFLGQHLAADGTDVDFVGGRTGVFDPPDDDWDDSTTPRGMDAYADPHFDSDHQSLWGKSVSFNADLVPEVMEAYAPDVLVHALGFNDLSWLRLTPSQLLGAVLKQVDQARDANPDVRIVLAQPMVDVSYWSHFPVAEYNGLLLETAPTWSTAASPVVVATVPVGLQAVGDDEGRDTWDGAHPDTTGQVKIAAQMAEALSEVGVGSGADPHQVAPVEGLRSGSALTVTHADERATSAQLSWVGPPGATGHDVWMSTPGADYVEVARDVLTGHEVSDLRPGTTYSFKVIARKYAVRSADDQFSPAVTVVVAPAPSDVPAPSEEPNPTDEPEPTDAPEPTVTPTVTTSPSPTVPSTVTTSPSPTVPPTVTPTVTTSPSPTPQTTVTPSTTPVPTQTPTPTLTPVPSVTPTVAPDPQPGVVRGLRVKPGIRKLRATWAPVADTVNYQVEWRRADTRRWKSRVLPQTAVTLNGLVAGARYRVRISALTPHGISELTSRATRVRGPRLARVKKVDAAESGRRVRLSWRATKRASYYRVERRVAGEWQSHRSVVRRTNARLRLPRGRHVLRVRAGYQQWNGKPSRRIVVRVR